MIGTARVVPGQVITLQDSSGQSSASHRFEFGIRHIPDAWPDSLNMFASTSDTGIIRTLQAQLLLPDSERYQHIGGVTVAGVGETNPRFLWHFASWWLFENSVEVCDGLPYSDRPPGDFCPWSSYVVRELPPLSVTRPGERMKEDVPILTFPNPVHNLLLFSEQLANNSATIFDVSGAMVWSGTITDGAIDVRSLKPGTYMLALDIAETRRASKFVKE